MEPARTRPDITEQPGIQESNRKILDPDRRNDDEDSGDPEKL
jgi:hypothetical protein